MAICHVICIPSTIRLKEENSALSKTIYVLLQIVRVTLHPVIHELNFLRLILLRHKSMHFRTTSSAIWHQTLSTQILLATFPYGSLYLMSLNFNHHNVWNVMFWNCWDCAIDISFHIIMTASNIIFSALCSSIIYTKCFMANNFQRQTHSDLVIWWQNFKWLCLQRQVLIQFLSKRFYWYLCNPMLSNKYLYKH